MKSTFTFEFSDEEKAESDSFLQKISSNYDAFFWDMDEVFRSIRKRGFLDGQELTEVETAIAEKIAEKYYELKSEYIKTID
jgi:hypothetical protein